MRFFLIIAFVTLLALPMMMHGQDAIVSYPDDVPIASVTLLEKFNAFIPEAWNVFTEEQNVVINAADITITLAEPASFEIESAEEETAETLLIQWATESYALELEEGRIRTYEFANSRAALTPITPNTIATVLAISETDYLMIEFAVEETFTSEQFQIVPIFLENITLIETIEPTLAPTETLEGEISNAEPATDVTEPALETTLSPTPQPVQAEPCIVQVIELDTPVRLGPATNRSVLYLLDDGYYTAIAQNTNDVGDQWYRLDKEEIAPESAAAEIWIASENVATEGDCANLPSGDAPPILRSVTIPTSPLAAESVDGETNVATNEDGTPLPPEVGLAPRGFTNWIFRLDGSMSISCEDGFLDTVNTAILGNEYNGSYTPNYREFYSNIFTANEGRFTFVDSNRLELVAPGVYRGFVNFQNGGAGFLTLAVEDPEFLTGTLTISNIEYEGTICTGNIPLTVEYPEIFREN